MQTPMFSEPVIVGCHRVAAYCGIHYGTVHTMMNEGRLAGELIGNRWMVRRADLDAWLARARRNSRGGISLARHALRRSLDMTKPRGGRRTASNFE